MRVSVILPVKDDSRVFACIESILGCEGAAEAEVIVVDNGSGDDLAEQISNRFPGVTVLAEATPGAYAARNAGVRQATGDIVFFTDADCIVDRRWIAEGLRAFAETGADIVQGFSGSIGRARNDRLIQGRYAAQFRRRRPGEASECDTRNLAVRREVFEHLHFNDRFRRVGDTEFGLVAEQLGYRVAYWRAMQVDHAHEAELATFVAKQVCHGWGAQRLMRDHPGITWHGGHLRAVARASRWTRWLPGHRRAGWWLARGSVRVAGALDRRGRRLPLGAALAVMAVLDKSAALGGHLLYEAGTPEPAPSHLIGRAHPRE
ncbi:MAG: glycosyltransferase [Chloroflexi bacterium]|nr:glycosyltransferase [Chloroflexota bacterium]